MVRILIAYSSKTGTAEACAHLLEAELKGLNVTVANLDREQPDAGKFDFIVIGSSIRFGKLRPAAGRYLRENEELLLRKPHGLFLCCGFGHLFEEYSEKRFSPSVRKSAFSVMTFGGKLKLKNASLAERLLLYFVRSSIRESELDDGEYTPTLPGILPENIALMASALRNELFQASQSKPAE